MHDKRSISARADIVTLVWATGIFAVVLLAVILISGQYKNVSFWLSTAAVIGLAYLITKSQDRLKLWRYPTVAAGLILPMAFNWLFSSSPETTPDISAATIIFIMALFWLPVVRHSRLFTD